MEASPEPESKFEIQSISSKSGIIGLLSVLTSKDFKNVTERLLKNSDSPLSEKLLIFESNDGQDLISLTVPKQGEYANKFIATYTAGMANLVSDYARLE